METNNRLREALDDIIDKIDTWRSEGSMEHWQYSQLFDIADAALAEPVKNCEVGTAKEQMARWKRHCDGMLGCWCCPYNRKAVTFADCFAEWTQMPYEAQEGAGK